MSILLFFGFLLFGVLVLFQTANYIASEVVVCFDEIYLKEFVGFVCHFHGLEFISRFRAGRESIQDHDVFDAVGEIYVVTQNFKPQYEILMKFGVMHFVPF